MTILASFVVLVTLSVFSPLTHTSILCSLSQSNASAHSGNHTRPHYRTELVIAWCGENIEWVTSAAKSFDHVIVYSKCEGVPPPQLLEAKNLDLEVLPNVGVCDHTYLHHIVTNWASLALWTVFYKGYSERKCNALSMIRPDIESYATLYCCRGNDGPVGKKQLLIPSFQHHLHIPAHNKARAEYFASNKTMGEWAASTFGLENAHRLFSKGPRFCYGGYFAVARHVIHRHPITVYEAMKVQQVHTLEEIDHFVERTWDALFKLTRMKCNANESDTWADPVIVKEHVDHHQKNLEFILNEDFRKKIEKETQMLPPQTSFRPLNTEIAERLEIRAKFFQTQSLREKRTFIIAPH